MSPFATVNAGKRKRKTMMSSIVLVSPDVFVAYGFRDKLRGPRRYNISIPMPFNRRIFSIGHQPNLYRNSISAELGITYLVTNFARG